MKKRVLRENRFLKRVFHRILKDRRKHMSQKELLQTILELRPDLQKQIEADMKREKLDPEKLEDHLVATMDTWVKNALYMALLDQYRD